MKKLFLILLIWIGIKTEAQVFYCDSISYGTSSTLNYPLGLHGQASNIPGTITWSWTVCDANLCYGGSGENAYFGQVSTTDTVKICYDATININGFTYVCTGCDTLVYNLNTYQWEAKMSQPTSIREIQPNTVDNGKIYDLLGRELESIPIGKMYIRNKKLYITK